MTGRSLSPRSPTKPPPRTAPFSLPSPLAALRMMTASRSPTAPPSPMAHPCPHGSVSMPPPVALPARRKTPMSAVSPSASPRPMAPPAYPTVSPSAWRTVRTGRWSPPPSPTRPSPKTAPSVLLFPPPPSRMTTATPSPIRPTSPMARRCPAGSVSTPPRVHSAARLPMTRWGPSIFASPPVTARPASPTALP